MMNGKLKAWYGRQQFHPGRLGWLVNPFYHARCGLHLGLSEFFPLLIGRVLDVGCGSKPYREMIPAADYVGMEIDTSQTRESFAADVYYDGVSFPVADSSFDGVLCSQVFEHVFTPARFTAEIHRVLKPGGVLVLAVPFVWDEHEQPYDYARYSSFGIKAALELAGLVVEEQRKTMADSRALFQLLNAYLYKITLTKRPRLNQLIWAALLAPVNLAGIIAGWTLPTNRDFYLDNIVLARKPKGIK
jgi:SAM-dependent methyltransferase